MVLIYGVFFGTTLGFSAEKRDDKSPLGCRDVGYQFELKVLELLPGETGEKQSLYFIFNALSKPIHLYQMLKDDSSRSMFLNHEISPRQWAVLSTSEKEVKYICTIDDPKLSYGKIVDCSQSLKVCEYTRVKYGMNNKGNYWLVKSNTSGGAVNQVIHYGIIPR
jgi:hypothetical protein